MGAVGIGWHRIIVQGVGCPVDGVPKGKKHCQMSLARRKHPVPGKICGVTAICAVQGRRGRGLLAFNQNHDMSCT